ncbi:esterase [Bifidobacterium tissieri]|uniref:Esterase n=2 Tax=Bifidobacterium tissieri TaxID=1630162 RepID=A0A261FFT2_9BIFI|nr:esterase [Bifidobacterium tissieri]
MPQPGEWGWVKRMKVSVPIFIILMGILIFVSHATTVPWNNNPIDQSVDTLASDTAVTFNNPGEALPALDTYKVATKDAWIDLKRPSTGETQRAHVLIRYPQNAGGTDEDNTNATNKLPGVVFMHGAGYGTADNSFGDVAEDLSSAGFVTATVDKPVWSTNDITRDYPGSAHAYGQVVDYLRSMDMVDPHKVGLYATSESTWISPYLVRDDGDIAFQILLSPMVQTPRHALGFFVAQDFAIVGANPGYQSIVRRVFSADTAQFGLTNLDFNPMIAEGYAIPTFVAYGSKDVMTAQVDGVRDIELMAHRSGNWNVTVRNYPVANHVMRLGDEAEEGTPLVDRYERDMVDWAVGTSRGLQETSASIAGTTIYQSIAVPTNLYGHPKLTVYGVGVHVAAVVTLLIAFVLALIALERKIRYMIRGQGPALGFVRGYQRVLITISATTLATLLLFFAGIGQIVWRVVTLIWGAAPESPGMIYWSWYAIQVVCVLVVWAWSRVFCQLLETASQKGLLRTPDEWRADFEIKRLTGKPVLRIRGVHTGPVVASTRLGVTLFVATTLAMFCVLLVFAFWGLFVY